MNVAPSQVRINSIQKLGLEVGDCFDVEVPDCFKNVNPPFSNLFKYLTSTFLTRMNEIIEKDSSCKIDLEPFSQASRYLGLDISPEDLMEEIQALEDGKETSFGCEIGKRLCYVVVQRESKNRFTWTTINPHPQDDRQGYPRNYHPQAIIEGKVKSQTFLTVRSVPAEKLNRIEFFGELAALALDTDPSMFYYVEMLNFLGGQQEKGMDPNKFEHAYQTPQHSNFHGMKSYFALLRYRLKNDPEKYKKIKLYYRQSALLNVVNKFEENDTLKGNRQAYLRIKQIMRKQARSIEKWSNRVSKEGGNGHTGLIKTFTNTLDESKQKLRNARSNPQSHVDTKVGCHLSPIDGVPYLRDRTTITVIEESNVLSTPLVLDSFDSTDEDLYNSKCNNLADSFIATLPPELTSLRMTSKDDLINYLSQENATLTNVSFFNEQTQLCMRVKISYGEGEADKEYAIPVFSLQDDFWDRIEERHISVWIQSLVPDTLNESSPVGIDVQIKQDLCTLYKMAVAEKLASRVEEIKELLGHYHLHTRSKLLLFAFMPDSYNPRPQDGIYSPESQHLILSLLSYYKLDTIEFEPATLTTKKLKTLDEEVAIRNSLRISVDLKLNSSAELFYAACIGNEDNENLVGKFSNIANNLAGKPVLLALYRLVLNSPIGVIYTEHDQSVSPQKPNTNVVVKGTVGSMEYRYDFTRDGPDEVNNLFISENDLIAGKSYLRDRSSVAYLTSRDVIGGLIKRIPPSALRNAVRVAHSPYGMDRVEDVIAPFFLGPCLQRELSHSPEIAKKILSYIAQTLNQFPSKHPLERGALEEYFKILELGMIFQQHIDYAMEKFPEVYKNHSKEISKNSINISEICRNSLHHYSLGNKRVILNRLNKHHLQNQRLSFKTHRIDAVTDKLLDLFLEPCEVMQDEEKEILDTLREKERQFMREFLPMVAVRSNEAGLKEIRSYLDEVDRQGGVNRDKILNHLFTALTGKKVSKSNWEQTNPFVYKCKKYTLDFFKRTISYAGLAMDSKTGFSVNSIPNTVSQSLESHGFSLIGCQVTRIAGETYQIVMGTQSYTLTVTQLDWNLTWKTDEREYSLEKNKKMTINGNLSQPIWTCQDNGQAIYMRILARTTSRGMPQSEKEYFKIKKNEDGLSWEMTARSACPHFSHEKTDSLKSPFPPSSDLGRIVAYKNTEGHILYKLTEQGLEFKDDGYHLHCTSMPGYYLKEEAGLFGIKRSIILTNGVEERLLVFISSVGEEPPRLYKINRRDNKVSFEAYSPQDYLFLAQIFHNKREYNQAMSYLKKAHFVKEMSPEAIKMLEEIEHSTNEHPDSITLKLRCFLARQKNEVLYGSKKESEESDRETEHAKQDAVQKKYQTYLSKRSQVNIDLLSKDEELEIIRCIKCNVEKDDREWFMKPTLSLAVRHRINFLQSSTKGKLDRIWKRYSITNSLINFLTRLSAQVAHSITQWQVPARVQPRAKFTRTRLLGPLSIQNRVEFDYLYEVARYGTEEEKENLRVRLQLTHWEQLESFEYSIIKCTLAWPRLFPFLLDTTLYETPTNSSDPILGRWKNAFKIGYSRFKRYPATIFWDLFRFWDALSNTHTYEDKANNVSSSTPDSILAPKIDFNPSIPVSTDLFSHTEEHSEESILRELNHIEEVDRLKWLGGELKSVKWDEAVNLFLNGQSERYRKRNPSLTDQQIIEIDRKIGYVLAQKTAEYGERCYGVDEEIGEKLIRTFLVFEYKMKLRIRNNQVLSLIKLSKKSESDIVSQQGTGSGKSKLQHPIIQYVAEHVMNVWPKSLLPTNIDDIQNIVTKAFDQVSETITFSRDFSKDTMILRTIHRILELTLAEGRQINMGPNQAQSAELNLIETLLDMESNKIPVNQELFDVQRDTLNVFQEMTLVLDESAIVQAPKTELNFSIGSPVAESPRRIKFCGEIFQFLTSEEIEPILRLQSNQQHLITDDQIKEIQQKLIDHMIKKFKISDERKQEFTDFVKDSSKEIPEWMKNSKRRDLFDLLRGFGCTFLKNCFQNHSVNVNYGLSRDLNHGGFAIPYLGNNTPSEGSEFNNIHETLIKTFHTYLQTKLDNQKVWLLIDKMQKKAKKEAEEACCSLQETEEVKRFNSYKLDGKQLLDLSKNDVDVLNKLGKDTNCIIDYVSFMIAPHVKAHPYKLRSTAQNLRSMFKPNRMITMSATPGHPQIYSPVAEFQENNQSSIDTENKIKESVKQEHLHTLSNSMPSEVLDEMIKIINKSQTSNFRMLIDVGALLKGLSNITVARRLLNQLDPEKFKGIVYFDDQDNMFVIDRQSNVPKPFKQSNYKPGELYTYCDHQHIFGVDTLQDPDAVALCSVDKGSTYDEVTQGVGRLRGFLDPNRQQRVEFAFTQEFKSSLGLPDTWNTQDLIELAKKNKEQSDEENLYRALKQQMHNELRSVLMKKIRGCLSVKKAIKILSANAHLVREAILIDPIQLYEGKQETLTKEASLIRYQKMLIQLTGSLSGFSRQDKSSIVERLNTYTTIISQCVFKTSVQESSVEVDANAEVFVDVNVEIHNKVQPPAKKQVEPSRTSPRKPNEWTSGINFYQDDWMNVSQVYSTVRKVINVLAKHLFHKPCALINKCIKIGPLELSSVSSIVATVWAVIGLIEGSLLLVSLGLGLGLILAVYPAYMIFKFISLQLDYSTVGLYDANEVIEWNQDAVVSDISYLTASNEKRKILTTSNFTPTILFDVFGPEQKKGRNVLMVKEEGKWTMIMGDQTTDTTYWMHTLPDLRDKKGDSKREVFVYDLEINAAKGSDAPAGYQEDEDFQKLIVRAKMLNGVMVFSAKELDLIRGILVSKERARALQEFYRKVHQDDPLEMHILSHSELGAIIDDQMQKV